MTVLSDGYLYGHDCSTGGVYEAIEGGAGAGCGSPVLSQISSVTNASHRVSTYKINVEKSPPGGSAVLMLTFSQPVTTAIVKITGGVRNYLLIV